MPAFLVALVPSVGVLLVFWIGIRALLQADRRERAAQARIEAAERLANNRAGAADSPVAAPPMPSGGWPSPPAGGPSQ